MNLINENWNKLESNYKFSIFNSFIKANKLTIYDDGFFVVHKNEVNYSTSSLNC